MKVLGVILPFLLLATGLKADLAFTASFPQPAGFVSPTQSFSVELTITNSPLSTEDIVAVEPTSLDFQLFVPGEGNFSDVYYEGFALLPAIDLAPGETLTVNEAFYMPIEGFSPGAPFPPEPYPPAGTVFAIGPGVLATYSDGSDVFGGAAGGFSRTISAVPEPSSLALLALIAGFVCFTFRLVWGSRPYSSFELKFLTCCKASSSER